MTWTLALVAALAAIAVPASSAARSPTYLERATIMDAFNIPERSWSSRCAKVLVSTVDGRYAVVTSPASPPRACVRGGQVGDGFELYVRATASALRWRQVANPCLPSLAAIREDVKALCF